MRKTSEGLEITPAEVAMSAYRAWGHAAGQVRELEDAPEAEQERWLRAAYWALRTLPTLDGQPVGAAVRQLVEAWASGDLALAREQRPYLLEWEACCRHLAALCDGADGLDDEGDVLALEAGWAEWTRRRPRRLVEVS